MRDFHPNRVQAYNSAHLRVRLLCELIEDVAQTDAATNSAEPGTMATYIARAAQLQTTVTNIRRIIAVSNLPDLTNRKAVERWLNA